MNREMPSKGKDPVVDKYRVAGLRRKIKRMNHLLTVRTGPKNFLLRFRIKICRINLRHTLKQLT